MSFFPVVGDIVRVTSYIPWQAFVWIVSDAVLTTKYRDRWRRRRCYNTQPCSRWRTI